MSEVHPIVHPAAPFSEAGARNIAELHEAGLAAVSWLGKRPKRAIPAPRRSPDARNRETIIRSYASQDHQRSVRAALLSATAQSSPESRLVSFPVTDPTFSSAASADQVSQLLMDVHQSVTIKAIGGASLLTLLRYEFPAREDRGHLIEFEGHILTAAGTPSEHLIEQFVTLCPTPTERNDYFAYMANSHIAGTTLIELHQHWEAAARHANS